jgi:DNA-binding transcriptional ArsR family regulator
MSDLLPYFRALSDRKRLRIAEYLARHERVPVTELGVELRMSQPLISWHLRVLRRAGVVTTLRTGRQVLCSLNRPRLETYVRQANTLFGLGDLSQDDPTGDRPVASLEPAPQPR